MSNDILGVKTHIPTTNGLTVANLKEILKNWPETDEHGNQSQVWLCGSNGVSEQVVEVWPLNVRYTENNSNMWSDIILTT